MVGILITSHRDYGLGLKRLLNSLNRIPVVVTGGYAKRARLKVTHNSYDYTGLIEFILNPEILKTNWILTLQDTMECGDKTERLLKAFKPEPLKVAYAAWHGTCNLCIYRRDYLLEQRDFILAQKNCTKLDSIHQEGALWKTLKPDLRGELQPYACYSDLSIHYPYSNVPRIKEHYAALDITKWKANYGQNMESLINGI